MKILKKEITGNYEIVVRFIGGIYEPARVFFSADADLSIRCFLEPTREGFRIGRIAKGRTDIWKEYRGKIRNDASMSVRIIKTGNCYRFWVNELTGHMVHPRGIWEGFAEPWTSWIGFEGDIPVQELVVHELPWLARSDKPVIPYGPKGSFYEEQAIPGGIIEKDGLYYMYFMAGMAGDEEGASRRTVGVATSRDLENWQVHDKPVIRLGDRGFDYDNLYPGSALILNDGRVAVVYAAQKFPRWIGFFLATADHPLGPFKIYQEGPIYKHFNDYAHEFDLIEAKAKEGRYMLFYSGFTEKPADGGPTGDRGYICWSDDLIHWRRHHPWPAFLPETKDNWDGEHIRPRGINRIGEYWYLWYEGCYPWKPPGTNRCSWWDMTGLARSKDLKNWEYFPWNPCLPSTGMEVHPEGFWLAWPRMWIKEDTCYIFYTSSGSHPDKAFREKTAHDRLNLPSIGLRKTSVHELTKWDSKYGRTFNLLG